MRRSALGCLLVLVCLLIVSAVEAQPARVFISRDGSDANPCFDAAFPCRSTQRGVDTVAPGGEVIVLSAGGFGPATITKALTIEANGLTAFISTPSGNALTIYAAK